MSYDFKAHRFGRPLTSKTLRNPGRDAIPGNPSTPESYCGAASSPPTANPVQVTDPDRRTDTHDLPLYLYLGVRNRANKHAISIPSRFFEKARLWTFFMPEGYVFPEPFPANTSGCFNSIPSRGILSNSRNSVLSFSTRPGTPSSHQTTVSLLKSRQESSDEVPDE